MKWPFKHMFFAVCRKFRYKDMTLQILGDFEKNPFLQSLSCTLWPEMSMNRGKQLICLAGWEGGRRTSMYRMAKD